MSKVTKKQLHNGWHCHDTEIIKMKKELRELKQSVLRLEKLTDEKLLDEPEPQLKQLDQSVFDGLDEKWRFAAVNAAGRLMYSKTRMVHDKKYWWASSKSSDLSSGTDGYDTSNWQNSLIERDITKELTGSELCRAMINKNDWVLAYVSDENDATAEFHQRPVIVTGSTIDGRFKCGEITWRFAVPINNQGEPLTAAEVGL